MPQFDKPFTEDEISVIYEAVEAVRNEAEKDRDVANLAKLDELCEKLGYWS